MELICIAGPYTANTTFEVLENIRNAEKVAIKYWRLGYSVICPHKNSTLLEGSVVSNPWLSGYLEIMKRCDIVVMMKEWKKSPGAMEEHSLAKSIGKVIIYEK